MRQVILWDPHYGGITEELPDGVTKPEIMCNEMRLLKMFFGKKKKTVPEISFDPKKQKAILDKLVDELAKGKSMEKIKR